MAQTPVNNGEAQIYLEVASLSDAQFENTLVMNVMVRGARDVYGAEFGLYYNPTKLQVRDSNDNTPDVQISPGPFVSGPERFVGANQVDPATGIIKYAITLLEPSPAVTGDGVLATIIFDIVGDGPYSITFERARLVSLNNEFIPTQFEDFETTRQELENVINIPIFNQVTPTAIPQSTPQVIYPEPSPMPWWAGLLIALLAGVVLFLLFILPRLQQAAKTTPVQQTKPINTTPSKFASRSPDLLIQQGQKAYNSGDDERAYTLFNEAIQLDPANPQAWLGKALVAPQASEKRICLQRVLALDGDNETAQAELASLK